MEDLALVAGIMLLVTVASIGAGAGLAIRALWRRRPSTAVLAHVVLLPGTAIALFIVDTPAGRLLLAAAAAAHLLAVWSWAFRRPVEESSGGTR